jgi:hypothetical protein
MSLFSRGLSRRLAQTSTKLHWHQNHGVRLKSTAIKKNDGFSIWYPIIGGFVITVGGGIQWVHDHVEGTEGLERAAKFYSFAIPKYIEYRYHSWNKSPDEVWEKLDKETSAVGLQLIYELEGFYIKSGQMVAANMGGAFPA